MHSSGHCIKALMVVLVLVWAGFAQADPLADFGVVQPKTRLMAPDFTLPGLDGKARSLSSYRGKVVMLHFWATWCVPCRQEMPVLHDLDRDFSGEDFVLLCVNVDRGSKDSVSVFMNAIAPHFNTLLDPNGDVRNAYAVRALPTSYLIGRDGKFSGLIVGERDWHVAMPMLLKVMADEVKSVRD